MRKTELLVGSQPRCPPSWGVPQLFRDTFGFSPLRNTEGRHTPTRGCTLNTLLATHGSGLHGPDTPGPARSTSPLSPAGRGRHFPPGPAAPLPWRPLPRRRHCLPVARRRRRDGHGGGGAARRPGAGGRRRRSGAEPGEAGGAGGFAAAAEARLPLRGGLVLGLRPWRARHLLHRPGAGG